MRTIALVAATATALILAACVTINVYFPAAEVQQAAKEFVDKVIGDDATRPDQTAPVDNAGGGMALLDFFIPAAHAQSADINIRTPEIQAIQQRMADRFNATLRAGFDSGALGFAADGLLVVRDASAVSLRERSAMNQSVADDNRDRKAVYREIAVANGHPDWEQQIRETFARQWIASAKPGWWYQTAGGEWMQK